MCNRLVTFCHAACQAVKIQQANEGQLDGDAGLKTITPHPNRTAARGIPIGVLHGTPIGDTEPPAATVFARTANGRHYPTDAAVNGRRRDDVLPAVFMIGGLYRVDTVANCAARKSLLRRSHRDAATVPDAIAPVAPPPIAGTPRRPPRPLRADSECEPFSPRHPRLDPTPPRHPAGPGRHRHRPRR